MILLIDNYDSFTYNLYQYVGLFADEVKVVRNDKITVGGIRELNPEGIILSPGPKSPKEAGICVDAVKELYREYPILGICLGHQSIGYAFGGVVGYAKELCHGKQSVITHNGKGLFDGLDSPLKVARYHSLAVQKEGLPDCLEVTAETDDGEIMAIRHKEFPVAGMQFHPESIYTEHGKRIIENFIAGRV